MKRALWLSSMVLLSIVLLSGACRQPPAAPPAATPAAAAAQPSTAPGQPAAIKPVPAALPAVLAKVNGETVERWELENALKGVEARAGRPVPPEKRDEVVRGVLDQLVDYHLLAQESRARKLDVSEAEITARLAQVRGGFPTEEAFQQALASQGLSIEQLKTQTRMSLQVSKVIDAEVNSKVSILDVEVDSFYQQNLERFKQGDTVHASHILIGIPQDAVAAQKQQARAKAQQLLKQVRGGADFAKLAREESMDTDSAGRGGDLGYFPKGQMVPAFEAAAFALKPGSVSSLVETPFGFHIIKVHERRGPRTAPITEVGGQIKEYLTGRQREATLAEFVDKAKAKGSVQILV